MSSKKMVFFVSEKNSCRSIIAQAYLLKHGFEYFDSQSFGLNPDRIHYLVLEVMQERNFNMNFYFSKGYDMVKHQKADFLIVMHPALNDRLPHFPVNCKRLEWNYDDPTAKELSESDIKEEIKNLADAIEKSVQKFIQDYK